MIVKQEPRAVLATKDGNILIGDSNNGIRILSADLKFVRTLVRGVKRCSMSVCVSSCVVDWRIQRKERRSHRQVVDVKLSWDVRGQRWIDRGVGCGEPLLEESRAMMVAVTKTIMRMMMMIMKIITMTMLMG